MSLLSTFEQGIVEKLQGAETALTDFEKAGLGKLLGTVATSVAVDFKPELQNAADVVVSDLFVALDTAINIELATLGVSAELVARIEAWGKIQAINAVNALIAKF